MQLYDLTNPEVDSLIDVCNFTEQELKYFLLKSRGKSNTEISLAMNISLCTVSKLARKVKLKVNKISQY